MHGRDGVTTPDKQCQLNQRVIPHVTLEPLQRVQNATVQFILDPTSGITWHRSASAALAVNTLAYPGQVVFFHAVHSCGKMPSQHDGVRSFCRRTHISFRAAFNFNTSYRGYKWDLVNGYFTMQVRLRWTHFRLKFEIISTHLLLKLDWERTLILHMNSNLCSWFVVYINSIINSSSVVFYFILVVTESILTLVIYVCSFYNMRNINYLMMMIRMIMNRWWAINFNGFFMQVSE